MCSAPAATCAAHPQHHFGLHEAELAVVDGHDRAMAHRCGSRGSLRVKPTVRSVPSPRLRVAYRVGRQPRPVGHKKLQARQCRPFALKGPRQSSGVPVVISRAIADSSPSNSPPHHASTPIDAPLCVQRRVETVGTNARPGFARAALRMSGAASASTVCIGSGNAIAGVADGRVGQRFLGDVHGDNVHAVFRARPTARRARRADGQLVVKQEGNQC